jgi:release factor glutamine methyltransferase
MNTIGEALQSGVAALAPAGEAAHSETLLLLAHVFKRRREWIVAHPEVAVTAKQASELAALCERRRRGSPIAYVLGSAGFYGRDFIVNEGVLVPRPETEHLVEEAIAFIRERIGTTSNATLGVLDVGVGCGTIACTIAAETAVAVEGTDLSAAAVRIAQTNAHHLNVAGRCRFHHGDLAEPVRGRRFDVVVANLPYVPTADLPQAPSPVSFEPRNALDGGYDGLRLYRRLVPQLPRLLKPGALVVLEAAPPTIEALKDLVCDALPNYAISIGYDYANLARYVKARDQRFGVVRG